MFAISIFLLFTITFLAPIQPLNASEHFTLVAGTDAGNEEEIVNQEQEREPGPNEFIPVEISPEIITKVKPVYPEKALKKGWEDEVWVKLLVSKSGDVPKAVIGKSANRDCGFEEAALEACRQYKFKPAIYRGKPVMYWVTTKITFRLDMIDDENEESSQKKIAEPEQNEFVPVDVVPELIESIPPVYPTEARENGWEGDVWVKMLISKEGDVLEAEIYKDSRMECGFEEAALEACRQFKFTPAQRNGEAVKLWVAQTISFRLNDEDRERVKESRKKSGVQVDNTVSIGDKSKVISGPDLIIKADPIFPKRALKRGWEGDVWVMMYVTETGEVARTAVAKTVRKHSGFEEAALEACRQYRFKPAQRDSQPVASWIIKKVSFRIDNGDTDIEQRNEERESYQKNRKSDQDEKIPKLVVPPEMIKIVSPKYPEQARDARIEGEVWVAALVTEAGEVEEAFVRIESGKRCGFEELALEAALFNKFRPAMIDNEPVNIWVTYKVVFDLY